MSIADSFGRSSFARFINTSIGRIVRIIAGLAMMGWGYLQLPGTVGIVLVVIGLIPFTAGVFHLCLISALLGGTIRGSRIAKNFSQQNDSGA